MERASTITYLKGETIGTEPEGKGEGECASTGLVNPRFHFPSKLHITPLAITKRKGQNINKRKQKQNTTLSGTKQNPQILFYYTRHEVKSLSTVSPLDHGRKASTQSLSRNFHSEASEHAEDGALRVPLPSWRPPSGVETVKSRSHMPEDHQPNTHWWPWWSMAGRQCPSPTLSPSHFRRELAFWKPTFPIHHRTRQSAHILVSLVFKGHFQQTL
uniref:Uncharacterized protein n=1 Tax=Pan troglodytes TaxID=9598 RepID=A0A2I3TT79_PANTR